MNDLHTRATIITVVVLLAVLLLGVGLGGWAHRRGHDAIALVTAAVTLLAMAPAVYFGYLQVESASAGAGATEETGRPTTAASTTPDAPSNAETIPQASTDPGTSESTSASEPLNEQASRAPSDLATLSLAVPGGMSATEYFGTLSAVRQHLPLDARDVGLETDSRRCASTIVVNGVSGKRGNVIITDIGEGWAAAEGAPSQTVSAASLRQQVIITSDRLQPGLQKMARAVINVDGDSSWTSRFKVELIERAGGWETWMIDGQTVHCRSE